MFSGSRASRESILESNASSSATEPKEDEREGKEKGDGKQWDCSQGRAHEQENCEEKTSGGKTYFAGRFNFGVSALQTR